MKITSVPDFVSFSIVKTKRKSIKHNCLKKISQHEYCSYILIFQFKIDSTRRNNETQHSIVKFSLNIII